MNGAPHTPTIALPLEPGLQRSRDLSASPWDPLFLSYIVNARAQLIDGATNATTTFRVGQGPRAIAVNAVTNKIYTANYGSKDATEIDGATTERGKCVFKGRRGHRLGPVHLRDVHAAPGARALAGGARRRTDLDREGADLRRLGRRAGPCPRRERLGLGETGGLSRRRPPARPSPPHRGRGSRKKGSPSGERS